MNLPTKSSRRKLHRGIRLTIGAVAVAGMLAACQSTPATQGQGGNDQPASTNASFGVLRAPTGALAVVAGDKGWFKDQGLNVDFKSFAEGGGPAIIQAMAGGTPDIALLNLGTAVLALAQGTFDVKVVSIPDDPAGALPILSIPSIKTVADLKGHSIACPKGGGQYYILASALAKYGLTFKDVDYKPLSVGDAQAAFLAGKVDAVVSSANGSVIIKQNKPDTRVLFDPSKDFETGPGPTDPFINPDVLIATSETVKNNPDAVAAFIKAYHEKGIAYLNDKSTHEQAIKDIQDYMKSVGAGLADLDATAKSVDAIEFYSLDEAKQLMTSQKFKDAMTRQAQFWLDQGVIKSMPDVNSIVDTDLISK